MDDIAAVHKSSLRAVVPTLLLMVSEGVCIRKISLLLMESTASVN